MRVREFMSAKLYLLALSVLISVSFAACSDDDDSRNDNGSKIDLPDSRVFILNEGTQGENNAGIAFYDPTNSMKPISDIFSKQNSAKLGDVGQNIIVYNNNMYVSVVGSNYITKLNAAGVEQAHQLFSSDKDLSGGIRYLTAKDDYIYASFWGGVVAKINAKTLAVESKITKLGNNLEGVTICNNELYVANSYKNENNKFIYLTDVFVIDLSNFKLKKTVTVAQNPNQLVEAGGKVFVVSWDFSSQNGYIVQEIDPNKDYQVTKIGYANKIAANGDLLYFINSLTDWSTNPYVTTNTFRTYNIKTNTLNATSFLKNAPEELSNTSTHMIDINRDNGDIYIGTTFFSKANGNIYRFKKDGTFVEKFDCGGQGPSDVVFINY